jgi:hypothetical protein
LLLLLLLLLLSIEANRGCREEDDSLTTEGGRPTALYTCVRIADKERCLSANRPTTAQSEANSRRVSYQGIDIDTCPFVIVCFKKTIFYIFFIFSICSSYFLFYNFYFFGFPAPFSTHTKKKKKKKKPFVLFIFLIFGSVL